MHLSLCFFGKPQYVVSRVTINSNMYQYVHYDAFQIVHNKFGFVNSDTFLHYLQTIFSTNLKDLKKNVNTISKVFG